MLIIRTNMKAFCWISRIDEGAVRQRVNNPVDVENGTESQTCPLFRRWMGGEPHVSSMSICLKQRISLDLRPNTRAIHTTTSLLLAVAIQIILQVRNVRIFPESQATEDQRQVLFTFCKRIVADADRRETVIETDLAGLSQHQVMGEVPTVLCMPDVTPHRHLRAPHRLIQFFLIVSRSSTLIVPLAVTSALKLSVLTGLFA